MADNVRLNTGSDGALIATDLISGGEATGAEVQRIKLGFGVAGSYADANAANPFPVALTDGTTEVRVTNGGLDVNIQDQHTRAFDIFFSQDVGSPTTLTTDAAADAYAISVTTGHGLTATDDFVLFDSASQKGFTGQVVSVAGDNTVNLDRPLDAGYPSATTGVQKRTSDLNVDGSSTRQTFKVGGSAVLTDELDVTRFLIQMTTDTVPSWGEFGDVAALSRGCAMRVVNGNTTNLWNAKSNAELANLMFDLEPFLATGPQGVNGLAARMTYGGQNKHGVTLRIGQNESIEFIVQDDLTDLLSFKIIACGHIVE